MTWNYRVVRENGLFSIAEVYYGDDGEIIAWSPDAAPLDGWDDLDDLRDTVPLLAEAFDSPVLDAATLP